LEKPDQERWDALWKRLGADPETGQNCFAEMVQAYAEPHRFYHTARHILHCLAEFDAVRHFCHAPDLVEAALWFHDVVYDTTALDNEAQSARFSAKWLQQGNVSEAVSARISGLILSTKHDHIPADEDARILCDIDIVILGASEIDFSAFEQAIRREYEWVPDDLYRTGRREILAGFLNRKTIYHTPYFIEKYEQRARENLKSACSALSARTIPHA